METKRVILVRFVDFDIIPTNVAMASGCQICPKIHVLLKNSKNINFGNYLDQFYIFYST